MRHLPLLLVVTIGAVLPGTLPGQTVESEMAAQLQRSSVRAALEASSEQVDALEKAESEVKTDPIKLTELYRKRRSARTDAEKEAVRKEMDDLRTEARRKYVAKAKEILSQTQMKQLRELAGQQLAAKLVQEEATQQRLGLSAEQRSTIGKLSEDKRNALRNLPDEADLSTITQTEADWNGKILAVLSDEQTRAVIAEEGKAGSSGSTPAAPQTPTIDPSERVASFGGQTENANPDGSGKPAANGPLSFNFRGADWDDVLKLFAGAAGLTLELNAVPEGTFTYFDKNSYSVDEALDIINGSLLQRGFISVRRDQFLVVLNIGNGIPPNLIPDVPLAEVGNYGENVLMRVVFPLEANADVESVSEEVEKLLGKLGSVVPLVSSQALSVTDVSGNIKTIEKVLKGVAGGPDKLSFKAFPLEHITPTEARFQVAELLGIDPGVQNVSVAGGGDSRGSSDDRRRAFFEMMSRMRGGDRGGDRGSSRSSSTPKPEATKDVFMATNTRTGTLLVTASAPRLVLIEKIIEAIDVEGNASDEPEVTIDEFTPVLKVYKVEDSDVREVAKTIDAMMKGVVVNEDGRNGLLHVKAIPSDHEKVKEWIRLMDEGGTRAVAVIPVGRENPLTIAAMLDSLFLSDGERAPTIQPDLYGTGLLVRGTQEQIDQIKLVLAGSVDTSAWEPQTGRVRRIQIGGQDAGEFARLLEQVWNSSNRTPVRIVNPRGNADGGTPRPAPSARTQPSRDDAGTLSTEPIVLWQPETETAAEPKQEPGITISVLNGELLITGDNEELLDRFERLASSLSRSLPPQQSWNVFYLRSADATDASLMLQQLLPSPATGVPLQIVPEIRTNALFVSGTPNQVKDVQSMLQILDESEIPAMASDRVPRYLAIEYADADDIAAIVRDVFAEELGLNRMARAQRSRDDRGGGAAFDNSPVDMTLGIDRQNNRLVVSANEQLYRQVEGLVETLDEAARAARKTVEVIPLQNADSAVVQQTLTSMFPKVVVTTSSGATSSPSRASSGSSRGSSSGRGSDGGRDDRGDRNDRDSASDDERRERFRQFMQQRMQQGGGSPFGGRGGDRGDRGDRGGRRGG